MALLAAMREVESDPILLAPFATITDLVGLADVLLKNYARDAG
jgi:hypothetical protein